MKFSSVAAGTMQDVGNAVMHTAFSFAGTFSMQKTTSVRGDMLVQVSFVLDASIGCDAPAHCYTHEHSAGHTGVMYS